MHLNPDVRVRRFGTLIGIAALLFTTALVFRAQTTQPAYRKAATWQTTMLAAREAMHDPADPLDGVFAGVWSSSGPYPGDAQPDSKARWQERPQWTDQDPHGIPTTDGSALYLRREVVSTSTREVTATLAAQAIVTVWLNGKQLFRVDSRKGASTNRVALPLQKGANDLLVKLAGAGRNLTYAFALQRPDKVLEQRRRSMDRLWARLRADFADERSMREMRREERDGIWLEDWPAGDVAAIARRYAAATPGPAAAEARRLAAAARKFADLEPLRTTYNRARNVVEVREILATTNPEAVRLAVKDLIDTFGRRYPKGPEYLRALAELEKPFAEAQAAAKDDAIERLGEQVRRYAALSREALLANPMLDFDKVLVIRRNFDSRARSVMGKAMGMPGGNWMNNDDIPPFGWDNSIVVLSDLRRQGRLTTFYHPEDGKIVTDVDLDFNASRLMFSSIGSSKRWRLFEIKADGTGLRQITPDLPDVDQFDSCYLPSGKIAFTSDSGYQGMPCIGGGAPMAQLFVSDDRGKNIRQITFEQDTDWHPTVLNDGRLMYLRWEYADLPHYFSRILFSSNPDGTGAMEYLHSNSYFPNSYFYARPIPGHPTEVVGVISGHHGIQRSGRLIVFDPQRGRAEAEGAVQEIPGRGQKVEPIMKDQLVEGAWPQFVHPYPLADYTDAAHPAAGGKYYLVSMKRGPNALWGIYLADVFDNLTLIKEVEGSALVEPVPFRAVPKPPVVADRYEPGQKEATVYLSDIYSGPGLAGIPRGTVRSLRLFSYHFAYNRTGGHDTVGIQSGWDVKRILGTVPVEADGSATFKIPADTPISLQPLDEQGRALQLMRSWLVGMPGEVVSCVGCHDRQNTTASSRRNIASTRPPSAIKPWYGPPRPFAFQTEVQPVLDRYCASCHDGRNAPSGKPMPNYTYDPKATHFTQDRAYLGLHPYVHRYGPEADIALLCPMEYHATTSPLFQMLSKGHHGVELDAEAMDRLVTWADLNVPWRGSWGAKGTAETVPLFRNFDQVKRRIELAKLYANADTDPEREFADAMARVTHPAPAMPKPETATPVAVPAVAGWPFDAAEAERKQYASGGERRRTFDLGGGQKLDLVYIPAGSFVMGDAHGEADEQPLAAVKIAQPFWMGRLEVSNQQYRLFDPNHDSRSIDRQAKDHVSPGYAANTPEQPVIRVTWQQAMAFCNWLSQKTGQRVTLPTEAQWEWAARAGTATPFWFGVVDANFARFANLADQRVRGFEARFMGKMFNYIPYVEQVDDGEMITAPVGKYASNPWGLADMHGNVAEWTLSTYKAYPYDPRDGRDDPQTAGPKVVRGGSWRDMPEHATSAYRLSYQPYQRVFDVGFRVAVDAGPDMRAAR